MREIDRVRLRGVWVSMIARCMKPGHRSYPWYGAKGVRVRFSGFSEFAEWAERSGYRPGLWIQRVDAAGDYTPGNCCWLTPKEQQRRRGGNRMVTAFGETKCLAEWADDQRCTVSYDTFRQRVSAGWEPERALTRVHQSELDECQRGHLFDEANTIIQTGGYRQCRKCYNDGRRARRAAARARGEKYG